MKFYHMNFLDNIRYKQVLRNQWWFIRNCRLVERLWKICQNLGEHMSIDSVEQIKKMILEINPLYKFFILENTVRIKDILCAVV